MSRALPCKFCKKINRECYEHCHKSKDGKHEALPRSAQQADGCDFTIDYFCKNCQQSGGVKINPKDIVWA